MRILPSGTNLRDARHNTDLLEHSERPILRKPTDNAYVESFNGSLRDECLNTNWFLSLEDARGKIEAWRRHYNESRLTLALGDVPPSEFVSKTRKILSLAGPVSSLRQKGDNYLACLLQFDHRNTFRAGVSQRDGSWPENCSWYSRRR